MARGLISWLGAVSLACVLLATAALTRSAPTPRFMTDNQPVSATAERIRARALATEWQGLELRRWFLEARRQLEPELARRRAHDLPSVALRVRGPDSLVREAEPGLHAVLDSIWRELGLDVTKIGVGLVLDLSQRGTRGAPGTPFEGGQLGRQDAYLFPDSTDRGTCLVTLGLENFTLPNYSAERLHSTLKDAVGPCAWYARFGMPGARVRRWLGARHYDLALSSSWDVDQSRFWLSSWLRPANGRGWYWPAVYQFLPRTIACLGSRPEACRQSVLEQDDAQAAAPGRLLIPDPPWDARRVRLVGGDHYLADVLRSAGDDRFLEFWNTTLPIDSALSLAVKAPIGAWTVSWQRQRIPTAPLTPVLRLHELLPALGAIGVSLLLVLAVVRRREVR